MSKRINVNPGNYKVAGRGRQGEDILHSVQKQAYAEQRAGEERWHARQEEAPGWEAPAQPVAAPEPEREPARQPRRKPTKRPKRPAVAGRSRKQAAAAARKGRTPTRRTPARAKSRTKARTARKPRAKAVKSARGRRGRRRH